MQDILSNLLLQTARPYCRNGLPHQSALYIYMYVYVYLHIQYMYVYVYVYVHMYSSYQSKGIAREAPVFQVRELPVLQHLESDREVEGMACDVQAA